MIDEKIKIADYSYELPLEKIANKPLNIRSNSKLLQFKNGLITDNYFNDLPSLLPSNCLLISNESKVIPARLFFNKPTGGTIEIFCLEPYQPTDFNECLQIKGVCQWICMVGSLKKWPYDMPLIQKFEVNGFTYELEAIIVQKHPNGMIIQFSWNHPTYTFLNILNLIGHMPLPPYIKRQDELEDKTNYQTVYAKQLGSVAAPTAGLHFNPELLALLNKANIEQAKLTLHVGAGTFLPVKAELVNEHTMHNEKFTITKSALMAMAIGGRQTIAVGTTTLRTLESLYWIANQIYNKIEVDLSNCKISQWEPYHTPSNLSYQKAIEILITELENKNQNEIAGSTSIIILPSYTIKSVEGLITNFHQPQSTLLLLVAAFVGNNWKNIYNYALNHSYRFLSYGDSSLLFKN
jgi:S-adenosylmethionine:tRNA ribosyltransferase-isomerase